ncbi:hypothetical protein [Nannocystis sp. SCPEA4]|uniref:hypothetical protein n=1 Tax=Nannocystis sp. SCPEA4 TaxID=2996787 RepID=UPI002271E57A|nr:hypothetical protein [Nannocystis sp. SCPEA4]MCY1058525.1 hypothetical protein [Nannocystis sp. SCPEA4]
MTDTPEQPATPPADPPATPASRADSRRKRRGTGPFLTSEQEIAQAQAAARARTPAPAASLTTEQPITPKFGRYERADFERVETMLASFATRRFGPFVAQVMNGFFGGSTPAEKNNADLRAAAQTFCLYGYRDPKGIRLVDMFASAGLPLEGRQRAALDACLQARLLLVAVDDVHVGKQRVRGKDLLRDEPVTLTDANMPQVLRPGDRVLTWTIPWGTSWQPIGVGQRLEARRAGVLDRGLETLCNGLRAVRRELPERHGPNLFWLVHRIANAPVG